MKPLHELILEASQRFPEGQVFTPELFLNLGSRAAVSRCLSRLVHRGRLMRVSRGLYVVPVATKYGPHGFLPPRPYKVIQSLAAVTNEVIVRHGGYVANALGLTTQMPLREIFLTNGQARTLRFGAYRVEIRCAPAWLMSLGATLAGDAIRALQWMGEPSATKAVARLHTLLPESEWQALESAQGSMPGWMADAICAQSKRA